MPSVSRSASPRQRRRVIGVLAASLPMFLLAGLLVAPGMASAGIPYGPDLVVSIQDDPDPVAPGGTVTFTVLVANVGNEDSYSTTAHFNTDGDDIVSATSSSGEARCSWEGTSVSCDLGYIPGSNVSEGTRLRPRCSPSTRRRSSIEVTAPSEDGQFDSSATADSLGGEGGQNDTNPSDNEDSETTTVDSEGGGDSDSGTIDPGETLSTVNGTHGNPVTTDDPFAVSLKNVERPDPRRVGERGAVRRQPGGRPALLGAAPRRRGGQLPVHADRPVADHHDDERRLPAAGGRVARLFYDRTVLQGVDGFKIFFQKNSESPVLRLQRCKAGVRVTECFKTKKKIESGDQIVRVALSSDPRVTRG